MRVLGSKDLGMQRHECQDMQKPLTTHRQRHGVGWATGRRREVWDASFLPAGCNRVLQVRVGRSEQYDMRRLVLAMPTTSE